MSDLLYARFRGPVASFRYPYYLIERQPSYLLPPLSTVIGLLQAAYGGPFPVQGLRLGYLFHAEAAVSYDLEKLWFLTKREKESKRAGPIEEFSSNVFRRELRVEVTLELFLVGEAQLLGQWEAVLRAPHFWVTLGRSQELVSLETVERQSAQSLPAEAQPLWAGPALFPLEWIPALEGGYYIERMPVAISSDRRRVEWRPCMQVVQPVRVRWEGLTQDLRQQACWVSSLATRPAQPRVVPLWSLEPLGEVIGAYGGTGAE